jgi:hypothetical protein
MPVQLDLFATTDLFENKNMNAVLNHLVTLAARCARRNSYEYRSGDEEGSCGNSFCVV